MPEFTRNGITRRTFINRSSRGLASAIAAQFAITRESAAEQLEEKKNIILIITDQERPPMWFPPRSQGDASADPPTRRSSTG